MIDTYGRIIDYLRISVTDRCNYRCAYCMPPEGVKPMAHADMLTYEEITRLVEIASRYCGISRVRLTGGEPLVRAGLSELITQLRALPHITDIAMTTNGSLFVRHAEKLKQAGLDRVNISLDTLDEERYRQITGGGALPLAIRAIEQAVALEFQPVKVNVVLTSVLRREDVIRLCELAMRLPVIVRFIEYMPIGRLGVVPGFSTDEIKQIVFECYGALTPFHPVSGAGPARNYQIGNASGIIGFITPMSDHFCPQCNRLRLTADGRLKPCLLSDQEINVRDVLRAHTDDAAVIAVLQEAVRCKPQGHKLTVAYREGFNRQMFQIGG